MTLLAVLASCIAVGAAARSTWSPCGLSMLSTITPMAERSRGRRWGLTATWFVLGAVLGGATLGLLAVLGALAVGALGLSTPTVLGLAAAAALVAAAMDLGIGTEMPHHRRQVNEVWLDQYRSWVYGLGFGWQIGTGLSTYIMTAAVYLTVVLASLTGSPWLAMGIAVLFGLVRGLAIFLGVRLVEPVRLMHFHERFDALGPVVRHAVIGLQLSVAVIAATAAFGVAGAVLSTAIGAVMVAVVRSGEPAAAARPSLLLQGGRAES
jgi:MFS family permease